MEALLFDYFVFVHLIRCPTYKGGHKGQLAPRCRALDAMIKTLYHGIQKAVHQFRLKNVE